MKHTCLLLLLLSVLCGSYSNAQTDTFRVVFAYNSAVLPAQFPGADWEQYDYIRVNAYSSGPGSAGYNMQLSKKRAGEIKARIESLPHNGIVETFSFGDSGNPEDPDNEIHRTALIICEKPAMFHHNDPPPAQEKVFSIEVRDILTQQKINDFKSTKGAKRGTEQAFYFTAEGYKDTTVFLSEKNNVAFLTPLQVKQLVRMENLLFYPNSAELLPESKTVLAAYLQELKNNKTDCFEVHGHVNAPYNVEVTQTPQDLQKLSENRALTVYREMRRIGIPSANIRVTGYSNTRMMYPYGRSEEQMRMNRRVEIVVVDCPTAK